MSTAEQAIISLVIPYCQHRFDFGPSTVSAMAAVMGFGTFFSEAWLFDFALARIGPQRLLIVRSATAELTIVVHTKTKKAAYSWGAAGCASVFTPSWVLRFSDGVVFRLGLRLRFCSVPRTSHCTPSRGRGGWLSQPFFWVRGRLWHPLPSGTWCPSLRLRTSKGFVHCCVSASCAWCCAWSCLRGSCLTPSCVMCTVQAMQGVIQGVRALTNGLGPAVFGTLLNVTVYSGKLPRMWQGSAFLVGTVCVLVAVAIAAKLPLSELHAASPQARSSSQHGGAAGGGIMHGHRNEGTNVITSDDGCPSDEDDNCGYSNCSRTPLLPRPCDTA